MQNVAAISFLVTVHSGLSGTKYSPHTLYIKAIALVQTAKEIKQVATYLQDLKIIT